MVVATAVRNHNNTNDGGCGVGAASFVVEVPPPPLLLLRIHSRRRLPAILVLLLLIVLVEQQQCTGEMQQPQEQHVGLLDVDEIIDGSIAGGGGEFKLPEWKQKQHQQKAAAGGDGDDDGEKDELLLANDGSEGEQAKPEEEEDVTDEEKGKIDAAEEDAVASEEEESAAGGGGEKGDNANGKVKEEVEGGPAQAEQQQAEFWTNVGGGGDGSTEAKIDEEKEKDDEVDEGNNAHDEKEEHASSEPADEQPPPQSETAVDEPSTDEENSTTSVIDLGHEQSRHTGDIVQLWEADELMKSEVMRNALMPNSDDRWVRQKDDDGNFIIPYVITGTYDNNKRGIIQRAIETIAANSCIRFKPRLGEADYVDIQNKNKEGCYTVVGRVRGHNLLMLEDNRVGTCLVFATVLHELLHKVGLWHEQMRYDRDDYITVKYDNIAPNLWPQFRKVPQSQSHVYGVKYDYRSVMHYDKTAFASNPRQPTMVTKDPAMVNVIGTARDASEGDWTKICSIYGCAKCRGQPFKDGGTGTNTGNGGGESPSPGPKPGGGGGGGGVTITTNVGGGNGGGAPSPPTTDSSTNGGGCPQGLVVDPGKPMCQPADSWLRRFPALFERFCCQLPGGGGGGGAPAAVVGGGAGLPEVAGCKPKPECGTLVTKEKQPHIFRRDCCEGCDTCQPRVQCAGSDKQRFPRYWELNCCGRCGDGWRRRWCTGLAAGQLANWAKKGLCQA